MVYGNYRNSLVDDNDVTKHTEHLIDAGSLVHALDKSLQQLCDVTGNVRPFNVMVLPLENVMESAH